MTPAAGAKFTRIPYTYIPHMNYSNKRRREIQQSNNSPPPQFSWLPSSSSETEPLLDKAFATLYVEAHEADVIHGKQNFALMLEPPDTGSDALRKGEKGSALVKWSCDDGSGDDIWVDRCVCYSKVYTQNTVCSSSPKLRDECVLCNDVYRQFLRSEIQSFPRFHLVACLS